MNQDPEAGVATAFEQRRRIRVMVADDDPGVRAALIDLIGDEASLELIGAVADAPSAIELARRTCPDIAILDVVMPGGGIYAAREISQLSPPTRIIGLSSFGDHARSAAMLEAGAVCYLVKGDSDGDLLATIASVIAQWP